MPLYLGEDQIRKLSIAFDGSGGSDTSDATLSSGDQMLQGVTAYSKGTKYTGTIQTVTAPTPDISVSSDGLIAASVSNPKGYQSESTTKTTTQQLTTKGATTITPSSASQIAVNSGVYTTGKITVSAVPTETKTITANGTYNPTSGKYYSQVIVDVPSSGIDTSDATATADDMAQGVTAYVNGQKITGTIETIKPLESNQYYAIEMNGEIKEFNNKQYFGVGVTLDKSILLRENLNVTMATLATNYGDATASDVLVGKTFTSAAGSKVSGTIPSKNAATITPSTTDQTIDAGQYLSGVQTIQGDVNLIPENIASGVSIFGVTGTHKSSSGIDTSDATATKDKILKDYTAYINNQKITGTLEYLPRTDSYGHNIVGINYNPDSVTIESDCVISDCTVQNPMAFLKDSHIVMNTPLTNFGDAAESDVISGKTFTSKSGLKKSGTLVIQKYYTGTSEPSSSLGNDGDIYLKA